jgi:DNA topoisomerase VI subunit A
MIFVVEKDATFQKLLQDPFMTQNAILITAKGMPDLNTRYTLSLQLQE